MSKRGSNIYKRKDGRYEGRVPIGYKENGMLRYKSVYARTLSEVKEKMAQCYTVRQKQKISNIKLTVAFFCKTACKTGKLCKLCKHRFQTHFACTGF